MIFEINDKFGNKLLMETGKVYNIYLKLINENRTRKLGVYDPIEKTLQLKRNSQKHYHYKSKSYGVNSELLNNLEIDKVKFNIDKKLYMIPISEFKYAKYLNFNQQGFELQKFLPTSIIYKYAL